MMTTKQQNYYKALAYKAAADANVPVRTITYGWYMQAKRDADRAISTRFRVEAFSQRTEEEQRTAFVEWQNGVCEHCDIMYKVSLIIK